MWCKHLGLLQHLHLQYLQGVEYKIVPMYFIYKQSVVNNVVKLIIYK